MNNPGESERKYVKPRVHRTLLETAEAVVDEVMGNATSDLSMEMAINEAKRIYNENKESEVK